MAEYAGLLAFPLHLHVERDVETHPFGFANASLNAASWRELQTLAGLLVIVAWGYALWRTRRRPMISLPLLLAVVTYLPVSGLITLNATVAEHWLYLPSAFLFLAGAGALESSGGSAGITLRSRVVLACLTIWLLALPVRTFVRTFDWKDQRTFLTRTIAAGGDSARMWINLGGLELSEGHLEAARRALDRALKKEPDNPLALLNLAAVVIKQRDFSGARAISEENQGSAGALGARRGKSRRARKPGDRYGQSDAGFVWPRASGRPTGRSRQRYIKALADSSFPDRAIVELKTCPGVAPYRAESWQMMSELLARTGRPNEAAVALREAEANDVHLHDRAAACPL